MRESRRNEGGTPVELLIGLGETGRVEGWVQWAGLDGPARFCGWLELLRFLENAAQLPRAGPPSRA